jgi:hypothetical protein
MRATLRNLRTLYGSWSCLADAMGVARGSLENVVHGSRPVSAAMALRARQGCGQAARRAHRRALRRGPLPSLREGRVTRRRRGACRPPAAEYEPAFPEPQVVIAEAWHVREHLRRRGVLDIDLDDVMQETMTVVAVSEGHYRPNPTLPPRTVLRRWILRIALNQLSHHHSKAHRRHEVPSGAPGDGYDADGPSLGARALAWETLRALAQLRSERRDVLALTALG